ncbi:MAG: hypothetical protein IT379_06025 [Deltaproteobacteria bacterium]|nr:hypothetical protein [Deltaproteobacteria bacterium]
MRAASKVGTTTRPPFRRIAWSFLALAVLVGLALLVLELAGARECTVVLSGGAPPVDRHGFESAVALGGLYTVVWLAAVALAPPLAMAALVLLVVGLVARRAPAILSF